MESSRVIVAAVAGPLILYAIYYFMLLRKNLKKPSFLIKERRIDFDVAQDFGTFFSSSLSMCVD